MEWIFLGLAVFGLVGSWFLREIDKGSKKLKEEAPARYAATFDGRDTAVFEVSTLGGPATADVIKAAEEAGYRFAHMSGAVNGTITLVFERLTPGGEEPPGPEAPPS